MLRFTRHAKNRMRLYGVTPDDIAHVLVHSTARYESEGATVSEALRPAASPRWKSQAVVRVVHVTEGQETVIITVMRDRKEPIP